MTARQNCLAKTTHAKDGSIIEGHLYGNVCAIVDKDTGLLYSVDKCQNCDKVDVRFCKADGLIGKRELEYAENVVPVGGEL